MENELTLKQIQHVLNISYPTALSLAAKLDARKIMRGKIPVWHIKKDAVQDYINNERKKLEQKQERLNDVQ